jgi:sporulation protein YlmC with PRC-barrel domain
MAKDDLSRVSERATGAAEGALVHLKDVKDFEFPKEQPDPRGWEVRTADGTKLGKVDDLLFDTAARRVRYLEVAVDKDVAKQAGRDYALLPVGTARLDDEHDDVIVNLSVADLGGVPAYDRRAFSRDYEKSLRSYLRDRPRTAATAGAATGAPVTSDRDADFYASPEYDDRSFFARRGGSGAADRATTTGVGDRIADAVDNVKDRIDANPASRPGPDPTDRRI